jgi:hypothetical protein
MPGFLFDEPGAVGDRALNAQGRPSWAPVVRGPAGRPEITAIVSFDTHCYLRFVPGASPLFLHEKFFQALQIFIVLYNEPSWTPHPR